MRYTVSIEISLPRDQVLQLLEEPAHRSKWLRGLVSHDTLHGVDGQVGTRSRVVFRSGQSTMECTETITRREPVSLDAITPDRVVHFERTIVADGMRSVAREQLIEAGPQTTRWVSENHYWFTGLLRWVAPFLRVVFIRQSRQHMQDFKAFAEHGADVRDEGT